MGGKNKAVTIGYRHFMTLFSLWARSCDYLAGITIGDETAFEGEVAGSTALPINKPELFGGDKKEGGVVGTLYVRLGEEAQLPNTLMQGLVPGPWPAHRGMTTTVFDGQVGALNPYLKLWKLRFGGFTQGWTTPVWHPELCRIGRGKNAMHILYQAFTDTVMGMGLDTSAIDEASWYAAAQRCYDEGLGLCLPFRRSDGGIARYVQTVCDHIGGMWGVDPASGKITFTLFRKDYDVDDLPVLDASNILRVEEFETPTLNGSTNTITVVGKDPVTDKEISATFNNNANVMAQGRVVPDKRQYPGFWNRAQVSKAAARDCMMESSLVSRITVVTKKSAGLWNTKRGDVFAFSWPKKKWLKVPVRVLDVDKGEQLNSEITMTLVQDFEGMAQASYLGDTGSVWTPPNDAPAALTAQAVYEATWRDLVRSMRPADLQLVEPDTCYLVAVGGRPSSSVAYGFELRSRIAPAAFDDVAYGDFAPTGVLSATLLGSASSCTLLAGHDLDQVQIGSEWMCGGEHGRVTSIDPGTGVVGLARGCVDTVPVPEIPAGTRMWFVDTFRADDPTEYLDGELVEAKLLTKTRQGTLDESLASALSLTMDARAARPYPPAKLRINGSAWPTAAFSRITLAWVHRDRGLQADQLIDTEAGTIGPEAGTTYNVRVYQQPSTLLHQQTGITGTTYAHDFLLASDASLRIEVEAIRDGLTSWTKHVRTIAGETGNKANNGGFGSDTGWSKGSGWAIAGGVASHTGATAGDLTQAAALVTGGLYLIEFTLIGTGGITPGFAGGTSVDGTPRTGAGTYQQQLTAATGNNTLRFAGTGDVQIDNVSLWRLT